jgi:surface antigen
LRSQRQFWDTFQQAETTKRLIKGCVAVLLTLLFLGVSLGLNVPGAHAQASGASIAQSMSHTSISQSSKTGYNEFFRNTYLGNQFPWPQCTWWANERYHQLHGIYVPWRTNSNAWQWTARAHDFRWHVSGTPAVGWIMDLQPWVQGAYGLGHVGVVEKVLGGGYFVASNLNWGSHPTVVTYVTFHAGSGVTFIHQ